MNESNKAGAKHPILNTIYNSPQTAAVISKLVHQPMSVSSSSVRDTKTAAEASSGELYNSSLNFQSNMRDQENAMELFPDLEMTKQTIISLILAPNNMTQEDMVYSVDHPMLTPDVSGKIVEIVREELEGYYALPDKLFKIFEETMFTKGAHIRMVLPESAVDHLINNRPMLRVESMSDVKRVFTELESSSMGFLGTGFTTQKLRQENYSGSSDLEKPHDGSGKILSEFITIGDNFGFLKQPAYKDHFIHSAIRGKVRDLQRRATQFRTESEKRSAAEAGSNLRVESFSPLGGRKILDSELKSAIYKSATQGSDLFLRVPEKDNLVRHSIGRPLDMEIPPEAGIPVHFPGDPSRHLGAFFLTDETGYFLSAENQRRSLQASSQMINMVQTNTSSNGSRDNLSSTLLEKAKQNLKGGDNTVPMTYLAEVFGSLLEEDLLRRIRNGIHGTEAALTRNNDIYAVMLARSMAGSQTRIIYVPKEFFTYFAFQHNANGTGRSLLADVKYLISLRAISMYAKIANQVRNAISITDINVELDPRDHNPQRTMEKIVDLASQTRVQFFPWGLNTPADIANWWHRAGFQLHVTGHKAIPATKIEYSQRNHDKNMPDMQDDQQLNDMIHMHFGITPEMRDASRGAQFATSIANQNILLTKRVMQYQKTANMLLTDYARVVANNDGFIVKKVRDLIKAEWGKIANAFDETLKNFAEQDQEAAIDFLMNEVIDRIELRLPHPDLTSIRNQLENFTAYKEALDATFDYIISDDAISQAVLGESAEKLVAVREPIRAQILRNWMRQNSFMPELFEILDTDSEGKPTSPVTIQLTEHLKNLAKNLTTFMTNFQPISVATAEDVKALEPSEPAM